MVALARLALTLLPAKRSVLIFRRQRHMVILVGIEPDMTRVKISYPKPLDDRTVSNY